jgi:branched-chain amino acid transport system permease protein
LEKDELNLPIDVWLQATANGIALGWLYVLMALGLTLMLSIMGILQLAHGEIYMIGAFVVYYLGTAFGLNLYAGIVVSMLVMAVVGIVMERFLFRPRPRQDVVLTSIVVSVGLTLILTSGAIVGFGLYQKALPRLAYGSFQIFGGGVPQDRIYAIGFSVVALGALYYFLQRTRLGQAMVASAQNREGSFLKGINPNQMSMMAMAIGCALAALAGALAGSIFMLQPYMGSTPMIKGLVIIVLGGLGSIPGALAGGMILGLIDGLVSVVFGSAIAAVAPLIVVIVLLLIRPKGMFGHD